MIMKLVTDALVEALTLSLQRPGDSAQEALQDVDDWDLTELNPDWDAGDNVSSVGESGDDIPSPLPPLVHNINIFFLPCFCLHKC